MAEAEVVITPRPQTDSQLAIKFWLNAEDREAAARDIDKRATLRLLRLANRKEILRRDWLKEDPIVNDLTILRRPTGTNFYVPDKHRTRLQALWAKTGTDWTYPECVAGLWAFHRTYRREVSKLPASPVSEVSLKIGRVVGGVYNKVMNFRALDPRDERTGLPGTGENDERVWRKFYDETAEKVRAEELETEYARLWDESAELPCDLSSANEESFEREVRVQQKRTLVDLLADYEASKSMSGSKPRRVPAPTTQFERDPKVVAIAKVRAGFRCELPDCSHPTFMTNEGISYCEVHHIEFLSTGGEDSPDNVACLCPAHHREGHFGGEAKAIRTKLISVRISSPSITFSD